LKRIRLIARLDIKGDNLIKGVHLEGLRVIGAPNEYAMQYYSQGIDELIFIDSVASLYGRNHLGNIISSVAKNTFVPMTVGGGIRSVTDAIEILRCGADKVAVNTAAVSDPNLILEISSVLGAQAMVLSVEAKRIGYKKWEVYTENGRESTGIDVIEWCKEGVALGAGEILLTSIDQEGTGKGFDLDLVSAVTDAVTVPVIASGGMGRKEDLLDAVCNTDVDAIAIADMLHYKRLNIRYLREFAINNGIGVRRYV
jgi:imidazole glycerol-phosphate synthase subunit HisF